MQYRYEEEMAILNSVILSLVTAIGIGLLIGAERERHKGIGPSRSPAGIRTFTVASLAGTISFTLGSELLLAVTTTGVAALVALAYWRGRNDDPGLTTEITLILTVMLGGLSAQQPGLAAGIAVTVAILLAARSPLHHFIRSVLTEGEIRDALIFAGATLVILPLLPDRPLGPYGALNPFKIWIVVILVMAISAAGYVAVRTLGARFGLPIAGFVSGFISSIATIGAMGARSAKTPDVLSAAVAGAVLSTAATIVQMAAVVATTSAPNSSHIVGVSDLRRIGRGYLWCYLHDPCSAADGRSRTAIRQSVQSFCGFGFRLDAFQYHVGLRRAPRMVRGDGRYCGGRGRRLRRHSFRCHFDCLTGRIGENECRGLRYSNPRWVFLQHHQQDNIRSDKWRAFFCPLRDTRPDPRCVGVMGRRIECAYGE